jgi:hypothetical protein
LSPRQTRSKSPHARLLAQCLLDHAPNSGACVFVLNVRQQEFLCESFPPLPLSRLIGSFPAASQSVQAAPPTTSLRVATVADWKAERDAYVQKARDEVQEWQRKLHDLREK